MKNNLISINEIYGSIEFPDPILELIMSAPFQRLKEVHQGGAIFLVSPKLNHTRYDHSIGVYALVTKFGGSLQERVAALLHDISHTAFSHVADQVFDHQEEDYHEYIFDQVIRNSEIPAILANYGLADALNNFKDYKLLEQPLPYLCADRIDYTLRDLYQARMIDKREIKTFLSDLHILDGKFAILTPESIAWFNLQYIRLNTDYFRRPQHLFANQKMAELIKLAISAGVMIPTDLLKNDIEVIDQLKKGGYTADIDKISRLHGIDNFNVEEAATKIKVRKLSDE